MRRMKASASPPPADDGDSMRKRILGAAFKVFVEKGYAGTSTLEIATRAKVSKRDLYASVGNKQAMLVAGITGRTAKMQLRPQLPVPRGRRELASILNAYATRLMAEVSHPTVIATFRLAIGEATPSPEIAQALEAAGRNPSRDALTDLFASIRGPAREKKSSFHRRQMASQSRSQVPPTQVACTIFASVRSYAPSCATIEISPLYCSPVALNSTVPVLLPVAQSMTALKRLAFDVRDFVLQAR